MIRLSTRKMVYMAFLIALSIILTRMLSLRIALGGVEGIRIGFGGLPIIFTGIVFGPLAGGIVGAVSDLLGYMVNPMGAYMPHFTLTSFLTGFIPGLVIHYLFARKRSFVTMAAAIAVGQGISAVLLVPYFLQSLFGVPLEATLIPRLIGQVIHVPVYAYLIKVLLDYNIIKTLTDVRAT